MRITDAYSVYKIEMANADFSPKTYRNYNSMINSILRHVGDIEIEYLGIEHVALWKERLRLNGNKASAINTDLGRLRMILKYLGENGFKVIDHNKLKFDKQTPVERQWLEPKEMQRLIDTATNPRDKAIVALLTGSACRISEVLNLDREDLESATYVPEYNLYEVSVCGKGDRKHQEKNRDVQFDATVKRYVDDYLDTRTDRFRPLFISQQNSRITVSRVEQIVHDLSRKAGLEKVVTPHILRHSKISDLLNNGAEMQDVRNYAGHASIMTTVNIYGHVNQNHKRKMVAQFSTPVR